MRIRLLFLLIFGILSTAVSGQQMVRNTSILNYQRGDHTFLHFGFSLGINYMDYRFVLSGSNPYRVETGRLGVGFLVGIVSELHLTEDWGVRFLPGLEFATRRMLFKNVPLELDESGNADGTVEAYNESVYVTLPLLFKYKAKRINNFRPFLVGGGSLKYDFQKHDQIDIARGEYFRTRPLDAFLELGVGSDFYLPYFKLGIELRYSLGLTNVLIPEHDPKNPGYEGFTDALKKVNARMFTICFHFE